MTVAQAAPGYAELTPAQVLAALDAVGLHGDGRILQLNSYENRVFQVFLEDGRAVVPKFYRPGRWSDAQIVEEHGFALELAREEVSVVPPLRLTASDDRRDTGVVLQPAAEPTLATVRLDGAVHRFGVAARCAGRAPELDAPGTLRRIGRFIGRLHAVGRRALFAHRRTLQPRADMAAARETLLAGDFVSIDQRPAWLAACNAAVDAVAAAFERTAAPDFLRTHGDCHPGNVLWRDEGPHVVDLDDAHNAPAVQDLWMLLSGDAGAMALQLGELLAGYRAFLDFDERELALIEPLRTLRMLRHSAWLAERWGDPAFPAAFPFFGTPAWWSEQTQQLREQLDAMAQPPVRPAWSA